jgi:hypothetical protein
VIACSHNFAIYLTVVGVVSFSWLEVIAVFGSLQSCSWVEAMICRISEVKIRFLNSIVTYPLDA